MEKYHISDFDYILEPSAGSGSFLFNFPKHKRKGLDLDPKHNEIIKMDFQNNSFYFFDRAILLLTWKPERNYRL